MPANDLIAPQNPAGNATPFWRNAPSAGLGLYDLMALKVLIRPFVEES
jgi:hypothetical protein